MLQELMRMFKDYDPELKPDGKYGIKVSGLDPAKFIKKASDFKFRKTTVTHWKEYISITRFCNEDIECLHYFPETQVIVALV